MVAHPLGKLLPEHVRVEARCGQVTAVVLQRLEERGARVVGPRQLFTDRQTGDVEAASDALITAVGACGWTADVLLSGPGFRRWAITGAAETVLIDLAVDSPGFDRDVFVRALRAHRRLRDTGFPDIGTSVEEIRSYFNAWAAELDSR